jgi:small subunit ribosomal protein S2
VWGNSLFGYVEALTGTTKGLKNMTAITFSMKDLIDAGVHFGHKTKRWNPKMAPFIYGVRNDTHIIDLNKTVPLFYNALQAAYETAKNGGRVLFVGTKRQASDAVMEAAKHSGQFYVNHRWLGGMLTNWGTIQNSIRRLQELEDKMHDSGVGLTKKELLTLERQLDKLRLSLGGIRGMNNVPNMVVVIDVVHEDLAIKEANKLRIPVVGIVDTNADIAGINYPIPGNDDATKAIKLYCDLFAGAIRNGIKDGGFALPEEKAARETSRNDAKLKKADEFEGAMEDTEVRKTSKKEAMSEIARIASGESKK